MNILILEDSTERRHKFKKNLQSHCLWMTANADNCIDYLKDILFDALFLDYDLGSEHYTGYDVACWLELHQYRQPKVIVIHSLNPLGAKRMNQALRKAKLCPGAWASDDLSNWLNYLLENI